MKINYHNTSSFSLEADEKDGRDMLFLKEFLTSIPKKDRELFSHFLRIETNVSDDDDDTVEEVFDEVDDTIWDDIVKITFCPYGVWCNEELKERINKRLNCK